MNGTKFNSAVKAAFVAAAMFAAPAVLAFVSAPSADAAAGTSVLMPGEPLYAGQSLVDGQYTMAMQTDGNFVLYAGNQSLWQSHTYNNPNAWAIMQTDGNLVVYSPGPTNVHALWQSGTYNQPGDRLVVQPDGNAVIYNSNYTSAPWATNTAQNASTRESRAIAWEIAHKSDKNWDGLCETAVEHAYGVYGIAQGGFKNARADYLSNLNAGRIHTNRNAPAGTLVFFVGKDPATGHVGLAVGDGQTFYTTDYGTIRTAPLSEGDGYEGWAWAPSNWPGA